MANYPSMSYCMCENTLAAMRQIMQAMEEEGTDFVKGLSESEHQAFEQLFGMCEGFVARVEVLHDEIEHDGQPDEAQEWESFDPDC